MQTAISVNVSPSFKASLGNLKHFNVQVYDKLKEDNQMLVELTSDDDVLDDVKTSKRRMIRIDGQ